MTQNLVAKTTITIHASADDIWKTLTTASLVKQYLMGTDIKTDWKVGSPVEYTGEYEGKKYHDKGEVKVFEPNKKLQTTYWSSMGGKPDAPENYNLVTYSIHEDGKSCVLTLIQDNNHSEKEKDHAIENWKQVLHKLKEVAEKEAGK